MIKSLFAAALLIASTCDAQTIAGVVRDTQCALLPGVRVVLSGESTERSAVTDVTGAFAFRDLTERRYSLNVSLAGFYSFHRQEVLPWDESSKSLTMVLPVGPLSETDPPLTIGRPGQTVVGAPATRDTDTNRVRVLDDRCEPIRDASVEVKALTDTEIRVAARGFIPLIVQPTMAMASFRMPLTVSLRRGHSDVADILNGQPLMPTRIRIVAMGDSTTAGTPAFESPREAPPNGRGDPASQYAYWLMAAHPGWDVVNQGINGQRSDQIRARFEEDVVLKKPAVVVIIAGVNDVYQGRPAEWVERQLVAMYIRAREAGIRVVAGTIIPYNTATPEQNRAMHEINEWIKMMGRDADPGVIFVDTRAAVASRGDPDRLASSPDGLHPDAAGYRRMADAIAPGIEQALGARR